MKTALYVILTACQLVTVHITSCVYSASETTKIPNYYWRDYEGIIPRDALKGGTDKAGNPTYVGQAYIRNFELLPVIIYQGSRFANTTAYASELTTDKNIKILCALDTDYFEWVPTINTETHLLINRHFVVGGSEVGQQLNIGRVNHDGQVIIGKVFRYPFDNSGLFIPSNGKPLRFVTYEILTYNKNCNKPYCLDFVGINVRSSP